MQYKWSTNVCTKVEYLFITVPFCSLSSSSRSMAVSKRAAMSAFLCTQRIQLTTFRHSMHVHACVFNCNMIDCCLFVALLSACASNVVFLVYEKSVLSTACMPCCHSCQNEQVCLSVCESVCTSVFPSICLSVCLSVYSSVSVCLSVCESVCLSVFPSVCLSVCLFVCLFVCLSVCLSIHLHLSIFSSLCVLVIQSVITLPACNLAMSTVID